jgi:DNA-binding NtrC family response regulator
MTSAIRVLIADDEPFVRESLTEVLAGEGMRVVAVGGGREALRALESQPVDVVVTDLKMPEGDGMALLAETRRHGVAIPILVVTGVGTVSSAVEAMKAGAFDFLQKPVDPAELVLLVRRAAEHRGLLSEVSRLRRTLEDLRERGELAGGSPAMQRVRDVIAKVAPTDATVLVRGESGTGKALAAEEIHRASSRAGQAFVRVSCAALAEDAFDVALDAQRGGRLATADGGTLVLDEIGTLKAASQARLLGFLERAERPSLASSGSPPPDVRVIAITNEDLNALVKSGAFRADLFYRLNLFPIEMPPLRAHKEDIPAIAEHLLERARQRRKNAVAGPARTRLSREALEVLSSYDWPGNVRELSNALERAVIVAGDAELDAELFRGIVESSLPSARPIGQDEFHLRRNLDALEKDIVIKAIAHTQGKKKDAALLLGIDPRNLGYYLRKHKITDT